MRMWGLYHWLEMETVKPLRVFLIFSYLGLFLQPCIP